MTYVKKDDKLYYPVISSGDGGDRGTGTIGKNKLGKLLTVLVYFIKYGDCSKIPDKLRKKIKENT
jgi:hypothetical protein